MTVVIISGSRTIDSKETVYRAIELFDNWDQIKLVVSGHQKGKWVASANGRVEWRPTVDMLGEEWAKEHNIPISLYPADWDFYGKAAGMIRNRQMAEFVAGTEGYSKWLISVWDAVSRGSRNMQDVAKEYQLGIFQVTVNPLTQAILSAKYMVPPTYAPYEQPVKVD